MSNFLTMTTITLELLNDKALKLIKDLEALRIVKVRKTSKSSTKNQIPFTALISEDNLAKDWLTAQEDEAWKDL